MGFTPDQLTVLVAIPGTVGWSGDGVYARPVHGVVCDSADRGMAGAVAGTARRRRPEDRPPAPDLHRPGRARFRARRPAGQAPDGYGLGVHRTAGRIASPASYLPALDGGTMFFSRK